MYFKRLFSHPAFRIFIFCLSAYLLTMSGHLYSADNEIKGLIAEGIVERHSVALPKVNMMYMVPGRDGLSYSYFPLGSTLTMIPFYIIGDLIFDLFPGVPRTIILEFCFSTINSLMTALACAVLFLICRQLKYSIRTATVTALLYGFTTITWPYAKTTWSEPQAVLCVLASFYFILRFREAYHPGWLVLSGTILGYGITTRHEMGLFMFIFTGLIILYIWRSEGHYRRLINAGIAFGIPLAFFGFLNLYYNYLRFEDWFSMGQLQSVQQQMEQTSPYMDSLEGLMVGLYQHLFSTGKGMLIYSPPLLMFYWAIKKFRMSHPQEALLCVVVPVVFFVSAGTSWHMTFMAWGERYFVSLTPFLILPLASLVENLVDHGSAYMRRSMITLAAAGFCVQMLGVAVNFQATSDKLMVRGDKFDVQMLSYDPEYSPILLNFKEFLSHFSGTWRLLNDTSPRASEIHNANGTLSVAELDQKANRETIRFNTFDFWFFYMYFSGVPFLLILLPFGLLSSVFILSLHRLFRFNWCLQTPDSASAASS